MRIEPFLPQTQTSQSIQRPTSGTAGAEKTSSDFGEQISGALDHVNSLQKNADELANQVASGNPEDAHKAVIAMEHALMAMDFTLQVRNKVLDAYQEIMKTQV